MAADMGHSARQGGMKSWLMLGGIAVLAIVAGLAIPKAQLPEKPAAGASEERTPTPPAGEAGERPARSKLTTYTPPAMPEAPDTGGMLTRLALGTVLVLALCVGTLWIGKRWVKPVGPAAAGSAQLRIQESLSLGNRCSLLLVQAGKARLIVGLDASGLKSVLPMPEAFDAALETMAEPPERPAAGERAENAEIAAVLAGGRAA